MHSNQSVVSAALRAVGNIVTGDDMQTQIILNCNALPRLLHLLSFNKDSIRKEACSTIFNITAGNRQQIQDVINANIFSVMSNTSLLASIIEYLSPQNNDLVLYAIRIIGNIVSWGESYAQIVIQAKALNKFSDLLTHQNAHIQREAVFTISNITAGNSDQIQTVIDANLVPLIVELFYFGDYKTQLEATYVMLNISAIGSMSQLSYLINIDETIPNMNIFDAIAVMLTSIDAKTVEIALQVYNNLLVFSSKTNVLTKVIKKCENSAAVYHIDSLQNHKNSHVSVLANNIMEEYFSQDLSIKEDLIFNAQLNVDGDKQMEFNF
jgi:importin subunit alpha-2